MIVPIDTEPSSLNIRAMSTDPHLIFLSFGHGQPYYQTFMAMLWKSCEPDDLIYMDIREYRSERNFYDGLVIRSGLDGIPEINQDVYAHNLQEHGGYGLQPEDEEHLYKCVSALVKKKTEKVEKGEQKKRYPIVIVIGCTGGNHRAPLAIEVTEKSFQRADWRTRSYHMTNMWRDCRNGTWMDVFAHHLQEFLGTKQHERSPVFPRGMTFGVVRRFFAGRVVLKGYIYRDSNLNDVQFNASQDFKGTLDPDADVRLHLSLIHI